MDLSVGYVHEFSAPFKKIMSLWLICSIFPRMNVYVMRIKLLGIFRITKAIKKVITRDSKHHQHLIYFSFTRFSSGPCLGFCCCFVFAKLTQVGVIWEKGTSAKKIFPPVSKFVGASPRLMIDVGGP